MNANDLSLNLALIFFGGKKGRSLFIRLLSCCARPKVIRTTVTKTKFKTTHSKISDRSLTFFILQVNYADPMPISLFDPKSSFLRTNLLIMFAVFVALFFIGCVYSLIKWRCKRKNSVKQGRCLFLFDHKELLSSQVFCEHAKISDCLKSKFGPSRKVSIHNGVVELVIGESVVSGLGKFDFPTI